MKDLPNHPAFPVNYLDFGIDGVIVEEKNGLTKREYFAAKAMQGILNSIPVKLQDMEALLKYYAKQYPGMSMFECVAAEAVGQADALIDALKK